MVKSYLMKEVRLQRQRDLVELYSVFSKHWMAARAVHDGPPDSCGNSRITH